ncbi:3-keto-5-aminohexanoate cleavage protein [Salinactinospora qingdaonensis]|uniref:3-keto-5-aminohexanoate cleavage protein n=1 Tax=Salinactinospora qingdaonensis TaxID=702744 RepID=A0ABP7G990_9ACTN
MRIVACLNGDRRPGSHPALPISVGQLVEDARTAVAAGATELHIHPHDATGAQSLEPQVLTPLLLELRAVLPKTPISVTTSLSAEPDAWRRFDMVQRWGELPDSATVNLHEPGSVEIARLLIDRRVGVEAGLWSVDAARILAASGLVSGFTHVLVEPEGATAGEALGNAERIDAVLDHAEIELPRLLHGKDDTVWAVLDTAIASGRDVRIGLEDTLTGPEGEEVESNAALVEMAVARMAAMA